MSQINLDIKSGIAIPYFPSTVLRLAYTPAVGELIFDAQIQAAYIGDGTTLGGRPMLITPGLQFEVTGVLTSAAAATPVILLADSAVPSGKAVYINWWFVSVGGAAAWVDVTGTIVSILDNASVSAIVFAKAGLSAKAILVPGSANTTYADLIPNQTGLTVGKGIRVVADAVFGAGSDLKVTVGGYIK
jgi:hypothetical protein